MTPLNYPALRIVFWMLLFIAFHYYIPLHFSTQVHFIITIILAIIIMILCNYFNRAKYITFGVLVALFFSSGFLIQNHLQEINVPKYLLPILSKTTIGHYKVLAKKRIKSKFQYTIRLKAIRGKTHWIPIDNFDLITNITDSQGIALCYPCEYVIAGKIFPINNLKNPTGFDYPLYLKGNGIVAKLNIANSALMMSKDLESELNIFSLSIRWHKELNNILEQYFTSSNLAILKALLIGNKDEIDEVTYRLFQQTSSLHVLSISGMHVGILLLLLNLGLKKLSIFRRFPILLLLLISIFLLLYCTITGMSPSVLRASLMCILYLIGRQHNKQINGLNILSSTAIILLIFNPLILFNVSFQLSFLAMLGIMLYNKKLNEVAHVTQSKLKWIWFSITLGISVQILVAPLVVYYFGQFTLNFLFSSISSVIFGTVGLSIGFLILITHFISPLLVSVCLVPMTERFFNLHSSFLQVLTEFKFFSFQNLHINQIDLIFITSFISLFAYSLLWRNGRVLIIICGIVLIFNIAYHIRDLENWKKNRLMVYSSKNFLIDLKLGNISYRKNDSQYDSATLSYMTKYFNQTNNIIKQVPISHNINEIKIGNQNILFANLSQIPYLSNIENSILFVKHFFNKKSRLKPQLSLSLPLPKIIFIEYHRDTNFLPLSWRNRTICTFNQGAYQVDLN